MPFLGLFRGLVFVVILPVQKGVENVELPFSALKQNVGLGRDRFTEGAHLDA